jgi:serine/threonine protein kinase
VSELATVDDDDDDANRDKTNTRSKTRSKTGTARPATAGAPGTTPQAGSHTNDGSRHDTRCTWGLGASLFYAAAGHRPFPRDADDSHPGDEDEREVQHPQLWLPHAPLPERVDPSLRKVIESCLTPDPAQRPLPAEIADMLEPMLAALPRPRLAGFKVSMR